MSNIEYPQMLKAAPVSDVWTVLAAWMPVSGLGLLPVNSYLRKGPEPMLVDTGVGMLRESFMEALESEMDPAALAWIWLSHMDADHAGNLQVILERAPNARVITTFLGAGKMQLGGIQTERIRMLEAGESMDVGGSRLLALRPPYYDAPETTGFFDEDSGALFVADSFGALLPHAESEAGHIDETLLREGMVSWSAIDAPWLADVEPSALSRTLASLEALAPELTLAGHLPLARRGLPALASIIAETYCAAPAERLAASLDARNGGSAHGYAVQ